jgi:hypothetical protein
MTKKTVLLSVGIAAGAVITGATALAIKNNKTRALSAVITKIAKIDFTAGETAVRKALAACDKEAIGVLGRFGIPEKTYRSGANSSCVFEGTAQRLAFLASLQDYASAPNRSGAAYAKQTFASSTL